MGYNSIVATAYGNWPMQDNTENTTVLNTASETQGTLSSANTSSVSSSDGPTTYLPRSIELYAGGAAKGINTNYPDNSFTTHFTWSAWVKSKVTTTFLNDVQYGRLVSFDNADNFSCVPFNAGEIYLGGASVGVNRLQFTAVGTNAWHHVCYTYNNTTKQVSLYVDGVSVGGGPKIFSGNTWPSTGTGSTFIGSWGSGGINKTLSGYHAGHICWNRDLSSSEIAELYAGPEPVNTIEPTLNMVGDWNRGQWDSQNNGDITYTIQLLKNSNVVETLTGESGKIDFSQYGYGNYQLSVSTSNDGGNDETQDKLTNAFYYGIPEANYITKRATNYEVNNVSAVFKDEYNQSVEVSALESFMKGNVGKRNSRNIDYLIKRFKRQ